MHSQVRPSAIAGVWYPGGPPELAALVDRLMDQAPAVAPPGPLLGLVVPHAGYLYSGAVAAAGFRQVRGQRYRRAAVLSPSHQPYGGQVVVPAAAAYATPLGQVPVDRPALEAVLDRAGLRALTVHRDTEHSLEIELPFLQRAIGTFELLPVMMEDQSLAAALALGDALAAVLAAPEQQGETLLVASSDLSHYHSYQAANRLDAAFREALETGDPAAVGAAIESGQAEACGAGPVMAVLQAGRRLGLRGVQVLAQANSGDVTGDLWRVVGYLSAALYG